MNFLNFWKSFFLPIRLYTGSSGGGGPTQTNVQNTNIPEYARPYVETMLGTAEQQIYKRSPATPATYDENGNVVTPASGGEVTGFKPYVPYGATVDANGNITNTAQEQAAAAVAPFSPLQQMSFYNAANLGLPGQYNTGTGYAALGGIGAANVADRAANVGNQYNMMATNPYATQAFMSPYIQTALQPQLAEMQRQYDITGNQMKGQAVGQGAFGGNRAALQQAENQRNKNMAMNQAIGSGYQNAFQAAQQAQQYGANLGLQGYGTALQGTGQLTNAGTALANIGSQQLQGQQGILGLQNQMGSQMQTQQQNMVNQAMQNYAMQQQYPQQQLSFMSGLLRGLPLQSATTQSYQAAPSAISQLSGLGLTGAAAYGLMKKKGGVIKSYAEGGDVNMDPDGNDFEEAEGFVSGGIAEAITNKVRMNPNGYSKQAIDKSTKDGIVDDLVGLAAIQEKNKQEKELQQQQAMMQPKPPTVKDQILAERAALEQQRQQGIEMAQSNLPQEYAGGGIVAFGDPELNPNEDQQVRDPVGEGIVNWWKSHTMGSPEALQRQGALTPEQAAAARAKQDLIGKQVETSNAAYMSGALDKPKDTGIKILGPSAPTVKPSTGLEKLTGAPEMKTDTGGIDEIIKQAVGDIKESAKGNADARKEAKLMGMLGAGLGIMGGTSPFAAVNFKGAMPALQGYQEEMRGIRADEAKQLGQIAALNLKGVELKQELKKLGITEKHYNDWRDIYLAKASRPSGTAGMGSVSSSVVQGELNNMEGYQSNPASAPFFKQLPQDAQIALTRTKPGTPSYDNSMKLFNQYGNQYLQNRLNIMRSYGAKQFPGATSQMIEP
jgi:hypothetical protein